MHYILALSNEARNGSNSVSSNDVPPKAII